jgi:hypothetical protein
MLAPPRDPFLYLWRNSGPANVTDLLTMPMSGALVRSFRPGCSAAGPGTGKGHDFLRTLGMADHRAHWTSRVSRPRLHVCQARHLDRAGLASVGSPAAANGKGRPMAAYAVAHLDEIEEFVDAGCHYRPIRHHLGIAAFGVTAWTARAAGDLVINEHDEGDPTADQELFLVLRGHAVFELDGDRVDAPAGTLVFASPRTKRMPPPRRTGRPSSRWKARPGRRTSRADGNSGLRLPPSMRRASTPRSPTAWPPWSQPIRSTPCCSSTSPAARVFPAGQMMRSITFGTPSRCRRSFAIPRRPTPTWIRSVTNPRSSN